MKVYEILKYGKYEGDIADGADDMVINMDGLTHSYDTILTNDNTTYGILVRLKLNNQSNHLANSEFTLAAGETISLNDWDITGIYVSNKSGTNIYLRILMGGE